MRFPPQINVVGGWHRCAACSPDGQAVATLLAPSAAAVLPPGTDLGRLLTD
ncbi:hypothetical protein AB0H71_29785 [Nocardia sp. NPDC050697]|uniref:hypothetical protein n=1 Tax=Nocardia sp. NPDC050697 TaxID=3155158 RepID=UPI0033CE5295